MKLEVRHYTKKEAGDLAGFWYSFGSFPEGTLTRLKVDANGLMGPFKSERQVAMHLLFEQADPMTAVEPEKVGKAIIDFAKGALGRDVPGYWSK